MKSVSVRGQALTCSTRLGPGHSLPSSRYVVCVYTWRMVIGKELEAQKRNWALTAFGKFLKVRDVCLHTAQNTGTGPKAHAPSTPVR